VLSPLQEHIARLVAEIPEAEGFALAGAAGLIVQGVVDRTTRDLDYFAGETDAVLRLLPALEHRLADDGLAVQAVQVTSTFARIVVTDNDAEACEVDLCLDHRLLPTNPSPLGPTLHIDELAANKVLALYGRAEARDFHDVAALEHRYGLERLCQLAADKDRNEVGDSPLEQRMSRRHHVCRVRGLCSQFAP
jgi:predicted regulator of Ras-like GTPase activity (Roadblock/LC7/MglB family)